MDLKDVIATVDQEANEAHRAFHAGHKENAEQHLMTTMMTIGKYLDEQTTPAGDVTESATSSQDAKAETEKPAAVPGAPAKARGVVPFADPSKPLPASQFVQPNQ